MSSSLFRFLPRSFHSSFSLKNNPLRFYNSITAAPATYVHRSKEDLYEADQARHRQISENRNIQDHKRRLLAAKYEVRRKLYKALCKDPDLPSDMREKHRYKLSKLPRNSSFTRVRNRCISTGRPRSVYELFRFSRIVFRDLASRGLLMGVKKSSW
uniref:Small ribosomal subunit protein uS14m n=1 Tax=Hepatica maxima TaxID=387291 RepID=A0A7L8Y8N0_9MAGN|nr:mitochondrial ribosomal protein S14 [Hepatica maxima]